MDLVTLWGKWNHCLLLPSCGRMAQVHDQVTVELLRLQPQYLFHPQTLQSLNHSVSKTVETSNPIIWLVRILWDKVHEFVFDLCPLIFFFLLVKQLWQYSQLSKLFEHFSVESFKKHWTRINISAVITLKLVLCFVVGIQQFYSPQGPGFNAQTGAHCFAPLHWNNLHPLPGPQQVLPRVPLPGLAKCSVPSWPYIPVKAEPWQWAGQPSEGPWASAALPGPARLRQAGRRSEGRCCRTALFFSPGATGPAARAHINPGLIS